MGEIAPVAPEKLLGEFPHRYLEVDELQAVVTVALGREFRGRLLDDATAKDAFMFANEKASALFVSGVLRKPYVVSVLAEGHGFTAMIHTESEDVSHE